MEKLPPLYEAHSGTIKISGSTIPRRASTCAWHFLDQGIVEFIDFMCIGANANQQAAKTMGIFSYQFEQAYSSSGYFIAFIPLRFLTDTVSEDSHVHKEKDCMVWRTVICNKNSGLLNITAIKETIK